MVNFRDYLNSKSQPVTSTQPNVTTPTIVIEKPPEVVPQPDKSSSPLIGFFMIFIGLSLLILLLIKIYKKNTLVIMRILTSKRNRGVFIISSILTFSSYLINNPIFYFYHGGLAVSYLPPTFYSNGFPFNYIISRNHIALHFSLLYFALDLIFWFIVVELILTGIKLIKD